MADRRKVEFPETIPTVGSFMAYLHPRGTRELHAVLILNSNGGYMIAAEPEWVKTIPELRELILSKW